MGQRLSRFLLTLMFAGILISQISFISAPEVASAGTSMVSRNAYDNTTLGRAAYGQYGVNYVMQYPVALADGDRHVSSIYVSDLNMSDLNMVEVGWYADENPTSVCNVYGICGTLKAPKFFAAWQEHGRYKFKDLGSAPAGTNHSYTLRNMFSPTAYGTPQWEWRIDGAYKHHGGVNMLNRGFGYAASERIAPGVLGTTNYSHFWNLQIRGTAGWYYWSVPTLLQASGFLNDTSYHLVINSDVDVSMVHN